MRAMKADWRTTPDALWLLVLSSAGCAGAAAPTATSSSAPPPVPAEQVLFCTDTAERWGVPECIGELDADAQRHRARTVVLYRREGRTVRRETLNGSGERIEGDEGAVVWEYGYRVGVIEEVAKNSAGRVRTRAALDLNTNRLEISDAWGRPRRPSGNRITIEQHRLDARGFVAMRMFFDRHDAPVQDELGVYGVRYVTDDRGLKLETSFVDASGLPMRGNQHFYRKVVELNGSGNNVRETYFDVDGRPVISVFGAHGHVTTYDRWGNILGCSFFDVAGNPVLDSRTAASWRGRHDDHGNEVEESFYGVDGRPALGVKGFAAIRQRFDARGRSVERTWLGVDGHPIGFGPILRRRYDERGRIVERSFHDAAGLLASSVSCPVQQVRYDDHNNEIEVRCFDADRRPEDSDEGAAGHRTTYDDYDQPVEVTYFGDDGRPALTRHGYASVRMRYDAAGALVKREHFDRQGKAITIVGAQHLLVMYQGSRQAEASITRSREEARARAEQARKEIAGGASFEGAVGTYSDEPGAAKRGGDLGKFRSDQMLPEFSSAVEALPVGQVSGVVETAFGFHVIMRTY